MIGPGHLLQESIKKSILSNEIKSLFLVSQHENPIPQFMWIDNAVRAF